MVDSSVGGWPGYDLACPACGSGCRPIDRFCSQCAQPLPFLQRASGDADLTAPTIVSSGDTADDFSPTFFNPDDPTDSTFVMTSGRTKRHTEMVALLDQLLIPGSIFGRRYRVQRFLGAGAMGHVCAAVDQTIDELVALKVLAVPIQEDPEAFERFKLELKLARRIRHRNVVQSFDLGFADGFPYISMEYIDADNLLKHLHRRDRFEERDALKILRQVLRGLRAAHNLGIIHRDIKPENILLNKDGMAFITDFGIATQADLVRRKELAGTPDYMAPEQLRCEAVSPASDLYACGVLLYRMLAGRLPFEASTIGEIIDAHLTAPPLPFDETLGVSAVTRELIDWMLQKEASARPQDAGALLDRIEPLVDQRPTQSAAKRVTALVVEDDAETIGFLRGALEHEGYRVVSSNNAREGVNLAFEQNPSIIFLDAKIRGGFELLPDDDPDLPHFADGSTAGDGIGFLRILHGDEKLRSVPIVVMADKTLTNINTAFHDTGVADVLLKPLSSADVSDAVRRATA